MKDGIVLPIMGAAAGAALMLVGSNQLSLAWMATDDQVPPQERWKVGGVAVGLLILGTALSATSTYELEMARR